MPSSFCANILISFRVLEKWKYLDINGITLVLTEMELSYNFACQRTYCSLTQVEILMKAAVSGKQGIPQPESQGQ
jgi:hypothetical protein